MIAYKEALWEDKGITADRSRRDPIPSLFLSYPLSSHHDVNCSAPSCLPELDGLKKPIVRTDLPNQPMQRKELKNKKGILLIPGRSQSQTNRNITEGYISN